VDNTRNAVVATVFASNDLQKKSSRLKSLDPRQAGDKAVRMPQEERAWIRDAECRLAKKYAAFSADYIGTVVQQVYAQFRSSRVRDFIPLLVERRADEELSVSRPDLAAVAFADLRIAGTETIAV
jgi:hypothetical protein